MSLRDQVHDLCNALASGLRALLGEKLVAVYIYGAVTFPETTHAGDVDFHVILATVPTDEERAAVLALHDNLAAAYPPLGAELDGYYILERDARASAPPLHVLLPHLVDDSWALHRAHMLAGRVKVLHGPDPETIYVPPTWPELDDALQGELRYVGEHLAQYPAYCVLNLCRLLYSWETRDVVTSKAAAAVWGRACFPQWERLIELAVASYAREVTSEGRAVLTAGAPNMFAWATRHIASLRGTGR